MVFRIPEKTRVPFVRDDVIDLRRWYSSPMTMEGVAAVGMQLQKVSSISCPSNAVAPSVRRQSSPAMLLAVRIVRQLVTADSVADLDRSTHGNLVTTMRLSKRSNV